MKKFWQIFYHLMGLIYIPEEIKDNSVKIMHITDTPTSIFGSILRLIRQVQPDWLIHTGDVADDIKLEMLPQFAVKYEARVSHFLQTVRPYVKNNIVVVPGNHDNIDILKQINGLEIYSEGSILQVNNMKIGLAHNADNLPKECDYYMYGHCRDYTDDPKYLNGIYRIHIVQPDDHVVTRLLYPAGTDDFRFRRSRTSI